MFRSSLFQPKRMPKRSKAQSHTGQCQLVISSSQPKEGLIHQLPISTGEAYVRNGGKLFWVHKKDNVVIEIEDEKESTQQWIEDFDKQLQPSRTAKHLSRDQLETITRITGHTSEAAKEERRKKSVLPPIQMVDDSPGTEDEWKKAERLIQQKLQLTDANLLLFKKHLEFSTHTISSLENLKLQEGLSFNFIMALICYSAEGAELSPGYAAFLSLCIYHDMLEVLEQTIDDEMSKNFSLEEHLAAAAILMIKLNFDVVRNANRLFADFLDLDITRLNQLEAKLAHEMDYTFPSESFLTGSRSKDKEHSVLLRQHVSAELNDYPTPHLKIKRERPTVNEYTCYKNTTYCLVREYNQSLWQLFRYENGDEVEVNILGAKGLFALLYSGEDIDEQDIEKVNDAKPDREQAVAEKIKITIDLYHARSLQDRASFLEINGLTNEKARIFFGKHNPKSFFSPDRGEDYYKLKLERIKRILCEYKKHLFWYLPTRAILDKRIVINNLLSILGGDGANENSKDRLEHIYQMLLKDKEFLENNEVFTANYNLLWRICLVTMIVTSSISFYTLGIGVYFIHLFIAAAPSIYYAFCFEERKGQEFVDNLMKLTMPMRLQVDKIVPSVQRSKGDAEPRAGRALSDTTSSIASDSERSDQSLDHSASSGSLSLSPATPRRS